MGKDLLQFVPFASTLDNSFWHQLTKRKLDIYKLEENAVNIHGFYSNVGVLGLPPLVNLDFYAFDDASSIGNYSFPIDGRLYIKNTVLAFQNEDKQKLIDSYGKVIWNDITSSAALSEPNCLSRLLCLVFADIKNYIFTYWFAFPAICYPSRIFLDKKPILLSEYFSSGQTPQFILSWNKLETKDKSYFLIVKESNYFVCKALTEYDNKLDHESVLLGFADPSSTENYPGWPLRNFLALVGYHWGSARNTWHVICLRNKVKDGIANFDSSVVLEVSFDISNTAMNEPNCVGWEKNEKHKLGPRKVNLGSSMNPEKLSESAVDLNLKLMKWRLVPEINLEIVSSTKCLLLGAGTLGCNIARSLIGWGIKNITFVDNGRVSYSNPVRQSLFTFEDCLNEGKMKASAAAEALRKIIPTINASGIELSIPMPGHAVPASLTEQTSLDVQKITELIENHDVIFLLTDTRESRWLPTLISASKQKLVINAALGFDTFMVIRHGVKSKTAETVFDNNTNLKDPIPGDHLGCYFCNDVVAPGDSTRDRTLDQQCTVTRPGVSMMAAALAVELLISLLQHPKRELASADVSPNDSLTSDSESILGIVPHQLRGFLSRFYNILPATVAFSHCPACSSYVVSEYEEKGFEFLLRVFNEPNYLEEISGLKGLQNETDLAEVWELSDSDS